MRKTLGWTLLFCLLFVFLDGALIFFDLGKQDFFSISKGQVSALIPWALSDLSLIFVSNWLLILGWELVLTPFSTRLKWVARVWLTVTVTLNLVILSPELFRWAWRPLMQASHHFQVRQMGLALLAFVLVIWFVGIVRSRPQGKLSYIRAVTILLLGLLLLPWDVTFGWSDSRQMEVSPNRRVLFLSIDSLRPEAAPLMVSKATPYLRKFLSELKPSEMITPIATTHAAFMSLLSGLVPVQHGVRFPIPETGLFNIKSKPATPVEQLRKHRVPIHFQADESLFMGWEAGNQVDVAELPERNLYMFAQTLLFRSRLFCGLYGGLLGKIIHPGIFGDRTHYHLYHGDLFADQVVESLQRQFQRPTGFVHVAHTSALHWPIPARAPKSLIQGETPEASNLLDFAQDVERARDPNWIPRGAEHYRSELGELYSLAARNVGENYLEPVLRSLYTQGLMDKMLVVLMSDHGESLQPFVWAGEVRQPRHGDSLLLWDDSNRAFLGVRFPPGQATELPRWLGIHELLPWICERVMKLCSPMNSVGDSSIPIESGPWPSTWFPQQVMVSSRNMGELFVKDFDHNDIHFSKAVQEINLVWKQRGIWTPYHKLMIYPTWAGYKVFLCAWREDRFCVRNQLQGFPQVANALLLEFEKQFAIDVTRGYLPPFRGIDTVKNLALIDAEKMAFNQVKPGLQLLLNQLTPGQYSIPDIKRWLHDPSLPEFFRLDAFFRVAEPNPDSMSSQLEAQDQDRLFWLAQAVMKSCPGCLWSVLRKGSDTSVGNRELIRRNLVQKIFGPEVDHLDEFLFQKGRFTANEVEQIGARLQSLAEIAIVREFYSRLATKGIEHGPLLLSLGQRLEKKFGSRFRLGSTDLVIAYLENIQAQGLGSPRVLFESTWQNMIQFETQYGLTSWRMQLASLINRSYTSLKPNAQQTEELKGINHSIGLKKDQN